MMYAEAAYFDGNHCAHVAAWHDYKLRRYRELNALRAIARR